MDLELRFPLFIGTVHHDPLGYERLTRGLNLSRPDIITVEISPYGVIFRKKKGADLRTELQYIITSLCPDQAKYTEIFQSPAIQSIFQTLDLPYEYTAAKTYGYNNQIQVLPIDLSQFSRKKLRLLTLEALTKRNIQELLFLSQNLPPTDLKSEVFVQYNLARRYFRKGDMLGYHYKKSERAEIESRDRHMSRILKQLGAHGYQRIVHIGGWEHLSPCPALKNLHSYFKGMNRLLLDQLEDEPKTLTTP